MVRLPDVARRIVDALPPTISGRLDLLRPALRNPWGGPLNGQRERRRIVQGLAAAIAFDAVLETGTYRGTSTEYFSVVFDVPVETVELHPRFYTYTKARLSRKKDVRVALGDSRSFLKEVAQRRSGQTVFVYLDAHWREDLPLREELQIISSTWSRAAVMVDDFAVPGDDGYGYDDYGPGQALVEEQLPPLPGWGLCYPDTPSDQETGAKRGCCVLLSPGLADARIPGLRISRTL